MIKMPRRFLSWCRKSDPLTTSSGSTLEKFEDSKNEFRPIVELRSKGTRHIGLQVIRPVNRAKRRNSNLDQFVLTELDVMRYDLEANGQLNRYLPISVNKIEVLREALVKYYSETFSINRELSLRRILIDLENYSQNTNNEFNVLNNFIAYAFGIQDNPLNNQPPARVPTLFQQELAAIAQRRLNRPAPEIIVDIVPAEVSLDSILLNRPNEIGTDSDSNQSFFDGHTLVRSNKRQAVSSLTSGEGHSSLSNSTVSPQKRIKNVKKQRLATTTSSAPVPVLQKPPSLPIGPTTFLLIGFAVSRLYCGIRPVFGYLFGWLGKNPPNGPPRLTFPLPSGPPNDPNGLIVKKVSNFEKLGLTFKNLALLVANPLIKILLFILALYLIWKNTKGFLRIYLICLWLLFGAKWLMNTLSSKGIAPATNLPLLESELTLNFLIIGVSFIVTLGARYIINKKQVIVLKDYSGPNVNLEESVSRKAKDWFNS